MRKYLCRRSAALAVAAVAVALLFANVAGALPGGGQGAAPAAPAVTAGAPHGAAAPPTTLTAMPDACPRGLSASQADRQAQQLASQRGSRSGSQISPNSNCCPVCDPPTTHATVTNPPTTSPPPRCSHGVLGPGVGMFSGVVKIFAMGSVTCTASVQSISLLVTIYEQVGDSPDPTRDPEVGRNSDSIAWSPYLPVTATKGSSPYCVPGKYYAIAQATVTIPPYQDLGKRQGPTVTIRDSDCS